MTPHRHPLDTHTEQEGTEVADLPAATSNAIIPGIPWPNNTSPTVGNQHSSPNPRRPPHREAAVQIWLTSVKSAHSQAAYARDIKKWFDWLDLYGVPLEHARRGDVDAYRSEMYDTDREPAIATVRRRIAVVSSFYNYWVEEEELIRNPAKHARRPVANKQPGSIALTLSQLNQLIAYVDQLPDIRPAVIIHLLAELGMRVSELCGAMVSDLSVSSGHRTLTITRKGNVRAAVVLLPSTGHLIDVYLNGRTSGPLVATSGVKRGGVPGHLDRKYVRDLCRRLVVEAGLPPEICERMHPHVLRHTAATLLDEAGVPMQRIQELLGHADIRQTELYAGHRRSLAASPVYALGGLLAA
jgi:integrase/recombinase XerD